MNKTIYIVLTETGSILSRAIQLYTREIFNHISIAFDAELQEMYSFGRRHENNPLIGGFVQEDVSSKLLRRANCAIYEYKVSDEQYEKLRMEISHFKQYQEQYKYNFVGLLCVACRIRLKREYAFFCSQFIATLFLRAGITYNICPYFTKPTDFKNIQGLQLLYRGNLKKYMQIPRTKPMPNIPVSSIIKIA
ncbi:hypothetical protein [Lysinibacillus odysseyi]|uniref:Uncharacterized protein n=1 Tax=Lysinibacillus odysseyi 34hs-1 = NBRC 100172 TaxID=1220589 RepID=A0A0A3IR21_9BACI|nr:hypothetical protein [Lysinibacillus odysseyi]KGR87229.1 hypothetical protein CD32_04155 [Lysinibacillus odysseyi 34hs-1 = NBRC 100172]